MLSLLFFSHLPIEAVHAQAKRKTPQEDSRAHFFMFFVSLDVLNGWSLHFCLKEHNGGEEECLAVSWPSC